jgi:hypothetical protein
LADDKSIKDGAGDLFTMAFEDIGSVFFPKHVIYNPDGTPLTYDTGAISAGTQRITIATDDIIHSKLSNIANSGAAANNAYGSGFITANTQRITIANDDSIHIKLAQIANTSGNIANISGAISNLQAIIANNTNTTFASGIIASNTPRITIATDDGVNIKLGTIANLQANISNTTIVAHDDVDSQNPTKIGAKATISLSTAIATVSGNDRTNLYAGVDGVIITRPHTNLEDIVTGTANNSDGTSTQVIANQGAGIKTYLTTIVLTNTHASTSGYVEIKDGTTSKLTIPIPASGGAVLNLPVPIGGSANTAWNFDPSAAIANVHCSLIGFKSRI